MSFTDILNAPLPSKSDSEGHFFEGVDDTNIDVDKER